MLRSDRLLKSFTLTVAVMAVVVGASLPGGAQTSPTLPARSLLQVGATGNDVRDLQGILSLMGLYDGAIDGVFSQGTFAAVQKFQSFAGLGADGIVGAATWGKLLPPAPGEPPVAIIVPATTAPPTIPASSPPVPSPSVPEVGEPILRKGAVGPAVSQLQRRLRALGVYQGMIDGGFGEETEAAVMAVQRRSGLTEDGIVGPATWDAIR